MRISDRSSDVCSSDLTADCVNIANSPVPQGSSQGEWMQPVLNNDPGGTLFVEMIFPEQANHYGTLFGGTALSLMGKAAFVAASRRARRAVVMATSDKIEFHMPVAVEIGRAQV